MTRVIARDRFFWFGSAGGGVGLVAEVPGFRLVGWDGLAAASAGPAVGVDDLLPALAELVVVGVGGFGHVVLDPSGFVWAGGVFHGWVGAVHSW